MKLTRREFVRTAAALAARPFPAAAQGPGRGTLGIATTSIGIRRAQMRKRAAGQAPGLDAEGFLDLCHEFGADGAQLDYTMLTAPSDAAYLRRVREGVEKRGQFVELIVGSRAVEDLDLLEQVGRAAEALGVTALRVACLSGRRYEDYKDRKSWEAFAARWRAALPRTEPVMRRHRLGMGIENHKDWRADELADILRGIGSPHVGACVDFGNNLAFLEDALDTVEKLAPYAVTTHVKDHVLTPTPNGFALGDVPLGEGVLPVESMVARLRKHRPGVRLVLEMITRDALSVPYREEAYWATFDRRDPAAVARFEDKYLKRPARPAPPRISALDDAAALAAEDENLRRSVAWARKRLGA
jgi:sugar phosphate isomerase/epimerase